MLGAALGPARWLGGTTQAAARKAVALPVRAVGTGLELSLGVASAGTAVAASLGGAALSVAAPPRVGAGSSDAGGAQGPPDATGAEGATDASAATARRTATALPQQAVWKTRALLDLHPRRQRRRVWAGHGHAHIEIRGLEGDEPRQSRVGSGVKRALQHVQGVRWAEINAVTGQALVAFEEGRVDVGTLLETVRKVETSQGAREETFSWKRPMLPSDSTPVAAAAVELASDCLALSAAVAERLLHLPPLPRAVRVAVAAVEVEPTLRRLVKRRIGPLETDLVLGLASAVVHGLSGGIAAPAIDAAYRVELLAETLSRRAVWDRREAELCSDTSCVPTTAYRRPPRPAPRPQGAIERWSEQLGPTAPAAAGTVLALTRDFGRAADTILAAVPKAARLGREGFATTTARRLADRGVLPMNPAAFRRLDRVGTVVLDSALLCTRRPQVLTVEPTGRVEAARLWQAATRALNELTLDDLDAAGPWSRDGYRLAREPEQGVDGGVRLAVRERSRLLGRVTVAGQLEPLADALLDAARLDGGRVVLTQRAGVEELLAAADGVLASDASLAEHVRRLQRDGEGVLVVSAYDDEALAAADVGVAVLTEQGPPCWSADLLCGPGLADAWRILRAAREARPVSERAVQLAQAGSALGTLLALVGGAPRARSPHTLAPVHTAMFLALVHGTLTGIQATRQRVPGPVVHMPWHALETEDVLARLGIPQRPDDAEHRVISAHTFAQSRVLAPVRQAVSLTSAVREELRDPLTPVLAVGATASAIVGSGIDAMLVTAVMGGNALISGTQRLRAENALRRLLVQQESYAQRLRRDGLPTDSVPDAEVLREADSDRVLARELVPGDVIALQASDVVPADARILAAVDLEVDESTLTGEPVPVSKDVRATPGAALAERTGMVYDGTTVVAGSGYAVVVATGEATEAGRATRAAGHAAPRAGVQARLSEVTRTALPVTAIGGGLVTGLGVLRRVPLREAVAAGVSVAVAAVPEGLPLVATVAQAAAARRLSRRDVLVRSARTLEALGRVDTVCFDKTGTLTEGRLTVAQMATPTADLDPDKESDAEAARRVLTTTARACPSVQDDDIAAVPHATDRAVLEAAARAGDDYRDGWQPVTELPFESSRGFAATVGRDGDRVILVVKGAPEVVLSRCSAGENGEPFEGDQRRAAERMARQLAENGLRVLAVAERTDVPDEPDDVEQLVRDLTLVGFVGIADRPRAHTTDAVRRLLDDGMRVVMLTGDHPVTAAAIARSVGISADEVVTGAELDGLTEEQRVRRVTDASVFARVSPEQKLRVVRALQRDGRVVAMAGDGINDAAAIRLSDVGIGVAAVGSTSARSAADLVLVEADMRRIHDALVEGRALWHRVGEAVSILVGGNAGEVAFMVLGTALSGRAPINTRQILLVNLLTDMFPALAVAVARSRPNGADTLPGRSALGAPLARAIAVRGGATAFGATVAWTIGRFTGRRARAGSMGLAAVVATQLGQTLLTGWHSPLVVMTSLASFGVLVAVIDTPGVSQFFGCTPVGPVGWAVVLGSATAGTVAAALAPRFLPPTTL